MFMRAVTLHEFGPAENLVVEDRPSLEPGADQVRISVAAAGVHLIDTSIRRGEDGPIPLPELPTVPGREVAGVVDAVGPAVTQEWLGVPVVAHLGPVPGGYADQAVTATSNLHRLDPGADFTEAVALVGTGRTAQAIVELVPMTAGDTVLVTSAMGGLGWLLVQAVQRAGARVVGAAGGAEKTASLGQAGVDLAVDYTRPDWSDDIRQELGGISIVLDGVGGEVGRQALDLLRPGGHLEMFGFSAGKPITFDQDDVVRRALSVSWSLGPRLAGLPGGFDGLVTRALHRAAAGEWRPLVSTYPLAEAARAHRDLEKRRAVGKVVLVPEGQNSTWNWSMSRITEKNP